ncbi:MAG: triose-phosphate isomerase [Endozoicomonas sp. (ex Botrylloides leachii)]|nr:triose-phosphate isomerase [Endozoicomonas sp. (ex Botrylloides leachii)]
MRLPLVAGNWKMNGSSESIRALLDGLISGLDTKAEVLVCPPTIYVDQVGKALSGTPIKWGVQTISNKVSGAFTGETSPLMAKDLGCEYAIIGHSERRSLFGETDVNVAEKFCTLVDHDVTPILCVGETLKEREADATISVVTRQLDIVFEQAGPDRLDNFVIAYEPVWAIGTGLTATPEQAQAVHACIRKRLSFIDENMAEKTRILYGGSMNAANAAKLMAQSDVDGGLIGGASLVANDFKAICHAAG